MTKWTIWRYDQWNREWFSVTQIFQWISTHLFVKSMAWLQHFKGFTSYFNGLIYRFNFVIEFLVPERTWTFVCELSMAKYVQKKTQIFQNIRFMKVSRIFVHYSCDSMNYSQFSHLRMAFWFLCHRFLARNGIQEWNLFNKFKVKHKMTKFIKNCFYISFFIPFFGRWWRRRRQHLIYALFTSGSHRTERVAG